MEILSDIQSILRQARQKAYQSVNLAMVQSYWLVGKRIVEDIQNGENRAEYGKSLLINLSNQLATEFGKGFSVDNLTNMRSFYLQFPISETLSSKSINAQKLISETASSNLETTISQTASTKFELKISQTPSAIFETPYFQLSWSHYLI
jgi:DUF1016 N-terminal domain